LIPGLVDQAAAAVQSVEGVDELRDRHTLRAEADVTVAATLTVEQAHDIAHHAKRTSSHGSAGSSPRRSMSARPVPTDQRRRRARPASTHLAGDAEWISTANRAAVSALSNPTEQTTSRQIRRAD
jgi:hypothetical protein